jgi:hypothetical protein
MTDRPDEPIDVQRVLMDRARRSAEQQDRLDPAPVWPRVVGLVLAALVVAVVLFAFDRFLTSMQRYLDLPVVDPEPVVTEPMPAYVVPEEAAGEPAVPEPTPTD